MKKGFFVILIVSLFVTGLSAQVEPHSLKQKIEVHIKDSRNTNFSDSLRNDYLDKALISISQIKNDSLKTKFLISLAFSNLKLGNWENYKSISYQIIKRSKQVKNTINLARAQSYLGYYYQYNSIPDSAFYYYSKALKSFSSLNNKSEVGNMLLSMATIQEDVKDYTGSEINSIKAISKLKNTNQYRSLYLAYNNLGVVYSELGKFNLAIGFNKKAIEYLDKYIGDKYLKAMSLNNIGWVYFKNKDYLQSINYYNRALNTEDLVKYRPQTYAALIQNLAYSKFKLGEAEEFLVLFYQSLKIRDSLNIKTGRVESNLYLAEYYLSKSDTASALKHSIISKGIAKESKYNEGLLQSYLLLSKLETDKKGKEYLGKYIKLSDSLQQQEREIREKFTRIAYETQEITEERDEVIESRYRIILFSIIGAGFSVLLFINMKQRSKNKELQSKQKQDETNVEIYNLMLSQQSKFQEGSNQEKNRISEELHDGILGRLFGARLSLDSLNEGTSSNVVKEREAYIEELQLIEGDIRKISHNLKTSLFNNNTSFIKLVDQLLAKDHKISKFEYELNFDNLIRWECISNKIKINCYRIVQESIQNINKHAKASKVQIDFCIENKNLVLTVIDDGIGYTTGIISKGIGQKNILSRATYLHGNVEIISSLGKGTTVKMCIPL